MTSRGSEWSRWEPHIHAPGTVLNNQFRGPTAGPDYLSALEQATPIIQAIVPATSSAWPFPRNIVGNLHALADHMRNQSIGEERSKSRRKTLFGKRWYGSSELVL